MSVPNAKRIRQTLLLGAAGDALGRPVEFSRASTIERNHGDTAPDRLAYSDEPPARFTDDTQMTLFVAEGLARALSREVADRRAPFREELARSLVHWLATQDSRLVGDVDGQESRLLDIDELHEQRAPGNTCLSSCRHIYREGDLPDLDNRINDSKGCGAIMRSAPFGVAASSARQAFDWARDAGVLTHCHPSGYLSAGYFAAVIFELCEGRSLEEAMVEADELLAGEPGAEETEEAVDAARRVAADPPLSVDDIAELGEGWVGEEALAIALAAAGTADLESEDDIRATLWLSVRHSGDSDSTGTLTGALLGAAAPAESMPAGWFDELELREVVEDCAGRLHDPSSSTP